MRYHTVAMRVTQTPELLADQDQNMKGGDFRRLQIALILLQNRLRIAVITLVSLLAGAAIAFSLKITFTATASILPPQAPQSTASMLLGQLGSLAGVA